MKKLGFILVIISLFNSNSVMSQDKNENCACRSENYNQISCTKNNDGTITQHWEIYNEKNIKIADAFLGNYKKRLN